MVFLLYYIHLLVTFIHSSKIQKSHVEVLSRVVSRFCIIKMKDSPVLILVVEVYKSRTVYSAESLPDTEESQSEHMRQNCIRGWKTEKIS